MKKNLLSLITLFSLSILSAQATVIFQEDFQGNGAGYDAWKTIDNDGNTPTELASFVDKAWVLIDQEIFGGIKGEKSALSISTYDPIGTSDDWIISPVIDLKDAKYPVLEFNAAALNPSEYADGYKVMISTTGGDKIEDFDKELLSVISEFSEWTKRTINLKDYAGKGIRIAFVNNTFNRTGLLVDDIKLTSYPTPQTDVVWTQTFNWTNYDDVNLDDFVLTDKDGNGRGWELYGDVDANDLVWANLGSELGEKETIVDNWITTPEIDLTQVVDKAIFSYYVTPTYAGTEGYNVYVSNTSDPSDESQFKQIFTEKLEGQDRIFFEKRQVDISEYIGKKIYITLRHNVGARALMVDELTVEGIVDKLGSIDLTTKENVRVYPNPTVDSFKIDLGKSVDKNNISVELYSMTGAKVKTFNYADSYDISKLPKGLYILKIKGGDKESTHKLLKK